MNKTNFKLFLNDITLGLFILLFILFLCNISGVFDYSERSLIPELNWRSLAKKDSVSTTKIIFSGNSITQQLNPLILDSITNSTNCFIGFRGASIYQNFWFFSNSWEYLNPDLVVLSTHSFVPSLFGARTKIDSIRYTKWGNKYPKFRISNLNLSYVRRSEKPNSSLSSIFYENKDELVYKLSPFTKNYSLLESNPDIFYDALFSEKRTDLYRFRASKLFPISDSLLHHYNNDWIPFPDIPIDLTVLSIVKKLIKEFQSRGIKVLVYESPMYYKHFKPQIQRRKQIDSFCQQLNIPFIDLNLETFLTKKPQYFENTTTKYQHLTSEGADAVSKILANKIVQLKLLSKNKN